MCRRNRARVLLLELLIFVILHIACMRNSASFIFLLEQPDTLYTQWRYIEHLHEYVFDTKKNNFDKMLSFELIIFSLFFSILFSRILGLHLVPEVLLLIYDTSYVQGRSIKYLHQDVLYLNLIFDLF